MTVPLAAAQDARASQRTALLAMDLSHDFERIIRSWGADHVHPVLHGFGANADLPMERMAILSGTLKGILVLRSSREFPAWLASQRAGLVPAGCREAEAFEELLTLFALYLFHDFWNPETFTVGPLNPFPSIPRDWPESAPAGVVSLIVEGFKVEARLWKYA